MAIGLPLSEAFACWCEACGDWHWHVSCPACDRITYYTRPGRRAQCQCGHAFRVTGKVINAKTDKEKR